MGNRRGNKQISNKEYEVIFDIFKIKLFKFNIYKELVKYLSEQALYLFILLYRT